MCPYASALLYLYTETPEYNSNLTEDKWYRCHQGLLQMKPGQVTIDIKQGPAWRVKPEMVMSWFEVWFEVCHHRSAADHCVQKLSYALPAGT